MINARPLITLTSDFGTTDGYVASMKGVLLEACPEASLVDITHEIPPYDILAAAVVLEATALYFPSGTVHVVVVDPGVGSERRAVAFAAAGHYFVGPDNGVFTPFLDSPSFEGAVVVETSGFRLRKLSSTFHGRDLFAPAAAHIARGSDYRALGPPLDNPHRLAFPPAVRDVDGVRGVIIHVDHFGNAVTSIRAHDLPPAPAYNVTCKGVDFGALRRHYAEVVAGAPIALINSMGRLEVAIAQGNAAVALGIEPGDAVTVRALAKETGVK
jgi:hypothetical protein